MINFKKDLNKNQLLAVTSIKGPHLVTASAGSGKCIIGESLVLTSKGLIPIKDIGEVFKITKNNKCNCSIVSSDMKGVRLKRKTSHWYNLGVSKVLKLKTGSGYSITGTHENPVVVLDKDGNIVFKKLVDITKGDYVGLSKNTEIWSKSNKVNKRTASLLGYLVANGSSQSKNTVHFSECENQYIDNFYKILKKEFNIIKSSIQVLNRDDKKTIDFIIKNKKLFSFLEKKGLVLTFTSSRDQCVPKSILRSKRNIVISFLKSYLDLEANVNNANIEWTTASKVLSEQIQVLMLNFGIRVSVKPKVVKGYEDRVYYRSYISGLSMRIFRDKIGFDKNYKAIKLLKLACLKPTNTNSEVYPNQSNRIKNIRNNNFSGKDFWNGKKQSLPSVSSIKDYLYNKRNPSKEKLQSILSYVENKKDEDYKYLNNLINNFMFEEVEYVKKDKNQVVYDFTVPKYHSFIVNGFVNHNTRVLVYRCAYLIEKGVDPEAILLLTFTNKAANEMLGRVSELSGIESSVTGGTFHSFAFKMLKRFNKYFDYGPNFTIMDEEDARSVIKIVSQPIAPYAKDFPKANMLKAIFSKSINISNTLSEVINTEFKNYKKYESLISKIFKAYTEYKKEMGLMDFDDLLLIFRDLLKNKKVRKRIGQRYKYIMIDEFQDTNNIQNEIVMLLCKVHNNIMVVGDQLQSVYKFRGANYKNIIEFPDKFKGCKVIEIVQNYRSVNPILDFTNQIIETAKLENKMVLFSKLKSDKKPIFYRPESDFEQAELVVNNIVKQSKKNKMDYHAFCVLYRSSQHVNLIEILLTKRGIPYVKYGGQQFVSKAHVKDVIALVKIIFYKKDPISWNRVLTLFSGIGGAGASKIFNVTSKVGYTGLKKFKNTKSGPKLKSLYTLIKDNRGNNKNPKEVVNNVVKYYTPIFNSTYNNINKRREDINSFALLSEYYKSTKKMLSDLTLDAQKDDEKGKEKGKVVLSTIHSAKGLEYKIVYVINLINGGLPSYQSKGKPEEIEEERRLFYVACTRAMEELHLIAPLTEEEQEAKAIGYKNMPSHVTPFIKEIENLKEVLDIRDDNKKKKKISYRNNY